MSYAVELGSKRESYGNVVLKTVFEQFENPARAFPTIFDVEYELFNDHGARAHVPAGILSPMPVGAMPVGAMEWLKKCGKPYRITANYRSKAAPESLATKLIGGESITYGYVLSVVFDDLDLSLLFKLTFGGAE